MKPFMYSFRLVKALRQIHTLIASGLTERSAIAIAVFDVAPELFESKPAPEYGQDRSRKKLAQILAELGATTQKRSIDVDDLVQICRRLGAWPESVRVNRPKADLDLTKMRCEYLKECNFLVNRLSRNITQMAIDGELDPIYGRQDMIGDVVQTLLRRNKANPILVGPAGVGKTAIVEGLVNKIVNGEIMGPLAQSVVLELSPAQLLARSEHTAQIAGIIQQIILECAGLPWVILFIDEVHTILSGRSQQMSEVANILKPALARRDIRLIGATTPAEYAANIETDRALERRVQRINVSEMPYDEIVNLTKESVRVYELYHQVSMDRDLIPDLVVYSNFYNPNHSQPDSVLSLVDSLMARARLMDLPAVDSHIVASVLSKNENPFLQAMVHKDPSLLTPCAEALDKMFPCQTKTTASIMLQGQSRAYRRPLASVLITTEGRGTTLVYAEELSHILYGRNNVIYYDLQEFVDQATLNRWLGSPAGYIMSDKGGSLITQLNGINSPILVLDNLDAAHGTISDVVRNMLTTGSVTDTIGRTAYLNTAIILATVRPSGASKRSLGFVANQTETKQPKTPFVGFGLEDRWPEDTLESILAFARTKYPDVSEESIKEIAQETNFNLSAVNARLKGLAQ